MKPDAAARHHLPWAPLTRSVPLFAVNLLAFLFYGAFICGCHFHLSAFLFGLLPITANALAIFDGISRNHRWKSVLASIALVLWLALTWKSNTEFYFHSDTSAIIHRATTI